MDSNIIIGLILIILFLQLLYSIRLHFDIEKLKCQQPTTNNSNTEIDKLDGGYNDCHLCVKAKRPPKKKVVQKPKGKKK